MALDQSAVLEVLDALKAADADDRIRITDSWHSYTTRRGYGSTGFARAGWMG